MFKTSLKSKLIVAVMVFFGITVFMSCEKYETANIPVNKGVKNVANSTKSNTPYVYEDIEYYYYLGSADFIILRN